MRILHIIDRMDPQLGGVCQAVRTMIRGLKDLNVDSEVTCLDKSDAPYLQDSSFPIHALGPSKSPWSYSIKLIPWLTQNLNRYDSVILHGMWLYEGYALYKACQTFKKNHKLIPGPSIFVMPHGMLDPYFQKASGRKFKALRNYIYWSVIENKIVNQADGLIFTCEEEKRLAKKAFSSYKPRREIVTGLGITPPPIFNTEMHSAFLNKCPQLEGQSYLLFLSRIHEKKGVDLLVKTYRELISKITNNQSSISNQKDTTKINSQEKQETRNKIPLLVIAGPGIDSPFGQQVVQLASEYKEVKDYIYFTGMLTGDAKWGAFYGCEAFVLPSHQENFGIVVAEALACGKPVLISNQVNIWREIAEGGGLVAEDTLEGTSKLLQEWIELSEAEKKEMGQEAKRTYHKYFAIEPTILKMVEALNT